MELLSAYIDSQLTSAARVACEERLRREPMLRAALDDLRATVVLLRELEPPKPPRSFALDPQAYPPQRVPLFARLNLGSALTAVALAFIFLTVFVVRGLQSGGGVAYAPAPNAASGGTQAFTVEATAQAETSNRSSAATAAPPDVAMGSAAEAPTALASGAPATAAPASADAQAAGDTGPASPAATAALPQAAQPLTAQQPSETTPPQESIPPIATSGSTSPGTSYLPPQPVTPASPVQSPIAIMIGLLLLLIVGLLWWTRRRRR